MPDCAAERLPKKVLGVERSVICKRGISSRVAPDCQPHLLCQQSTVSLFNGFCRTVSALSANGLLEADQIENIHDAMIYPLDDPDHGDEPIVTFARTQVEKVLSKALRDVRES